MEITKNEKIWFAMMMLSVVATLYKTEEYIEEFFLRIVKIIDKLNISDYEIIFVDDGSPDNSLERAIFLTKDSHVKVIELSRNFGHHKAMMTGLQNAKGDLVFLIDSDLEEEPELLESFYQELKAKKCDVVYGIQGERKGNFFERISGPLYYKIFNFFSGINIPQNIITARLMKKNYVDALVSFKERELNCAGVWSLTGFDQRPYIVKKGSHSPTTYSLSKKISIMVSAITNFSSRPLFLICFFGGFVSVFSVFYVVYLLIHKIFLNKIPDGWTSLMASIWLIGGLIIFFIGIVGIYISKIFTEVKQRPYTIIKKIYGGKG